MNKLKGHSSNKTAHFAPRVRWQVTDNTIDFTFIVDSMKPFNTNEKFTSDYKDNWGLWEFDVVEIFIKKEDSEDYLEFQLSPLAQPFALIISKPRVEFCAPDKLDIDYEVTTKGVWESSISIPFDEIPGSSNQIIGNCFACLGASREFFALNINNEEIPDFHRPDLFINLGSIGDTDER